jgi:uncharacterized cupin superfamily protein
MNVVNVISKVRFNSARPQRVNLEKSGGLVCDLLCLEPGQENAGGQACAYYVIAGSGQLKTSQGKSDLVMGTLAVIDSGQAHTIVNSLEQRLICLLLSLKT